MLHQVVQLDLLLTETDTHKKYFNFVKLISTSHLKKR